VTLALGMKFGEHEYKVMGMAPYAADKYASRAEAALREVFDLDEQTPRALPLAQVRGTLRSAPEGDAWTALRTRVRPGGAQRLLEDTLLRWARLMHQRTEARGWPWAAGCS